jgi:hypothetical protein
MYRTALFHKRGFVQNLCNEKRDKRGNGHLGKVMRSYVAEVSPMPTHRGVALNVVAYSAGTPARA